MSNGFTEAALRRLARCLQLEVGFDDAPDPLRVQPTSPDGPAMAAWDINRSVDTTPAEAARIGFLGLVELAAEAGFIDPYHWVGWPHISRAVRALAEAVGAERMAAPRLRCVERLRQRAIAGEMMPVTIGTASPPGPPPSPRDQRAFDAFESYLGLTRAVFADAALIKSLNVLHGAWRPEDDRAALLAPRLLAEALSVEKVGDVEVRGIPGVPTSLAAFEWLSAILTRVGHRPELRDGIIVHAHWSHAAWVMRRRGDEWARAMSEWTGPRRDVDGEARWTEFRARVFRSLEKEQARLELEDTHNEHVSRYADPDTMSWGDEVPLRLVERRVGALLAEGRREAARRALRAAVAILSATVQVHVHVIDVDVNVNDETYQLLKYARSLADLDDPDSAAGLIAPLMGDLLQKFGPAHPFIAQARDLMARARRHAPEETPGQRAEGDVRRPAPGLAVGDPDGEIRREQRFRIQEENA